MLLAGLMASCGGDRQVDGALASADSLMFVAPDSAVTLLDSVSLGHASDAQRSRHAVLLAKAREKANIVPADNNPDSLLSRSIDALDSAADYYRGSGDSLEVQALFYRGVLLNYRKDYSEALISLMEAADRAAAINDNFYRAMAYREQASIYYDLLAYNNCRNYSELAAHYFKKAGKPLHSIWERIEVAYAYERLSKPDSSLLILNEIKPYLSIGDGSELKSSWHRIYAHSLYSKKQYDDALKHLDSIFKEGKYANTNDIFMTGMALLAKGHIDEASEKLNVVWNNRVTHSDSAAAHYFSALINEAKGFSDKALTDRINYEYVSNLRKDQLLTHPFASAINDFYRDKTSSTIESVAKERQIWVLLISIAVLILIILCITIKLKQVRHLVQVHELSARIKELDLIIENSKQTTKSTNINHSVNPQELIKYIDTVLTQWFLIPKSKKMDIESSQHNTIRLNEIRTILEETLNKISDGLMYRFRHDYPNLNQEQNTIALATFLRLSPEAGCALIGLDRKNNYAVYKHRLKEALGRPGSSPDPYLVYFTK